MWPFSEPELPLGQEDKKGSMDWPFAALEVWPYRQPCYYTCLLRHWSEKSSSYKCRNSSIWVVRETLLFTTDVENTFTMHILISPTVNMLWILKTYYTARLISSHLWWPTCSSPSHQPVEFLASNTISCPGDRHSWCIVGATVAVTAWAISVDQTHTAEEDFRWCQENNRVRVNWWTVCVCMWVAVLMFTWFLGWTSRFWHLN